MKTPAVILTLSAVIALPCYSQTTVPADLRAAMTERAAALQKADATTWARFTADNFVVVTGAGIVQTKAERVAQIKAGQPNGPSTSENETVHVYGHNALQRFESTRDGIWVTFVWTKDQNGWRVSFAQVTPIFPDSAAVWRALGEANTRFSESFKRGDAAALASTYTSDAVVMLSNAPSWDGAEAIRQGFSAFLTNISVPNFKLTTTDILIDAGHAIERGTYEMTMHPKAAGAADVTDKGKYITVWERQPDGSWKISRDMSNSDGPPAK